MRYRDDLEVWTDPAGAGVLVLGRGLAGRRELSFEVDGQARARPGPAVDHRRSS